MNIEEYISSGIIEQYVLGLATPEEIMEVERMADAHPEVRTAIESNRSALEEFVDLQRVTPSPERKAAVMEAIRAENLKKENIIPVRHKESATIYSFTKWKNIAAAASVLLLISLAVNGIYIYKYQQTRERYATLLTSQQQMAAKNDAMQTRIDNVEQDMHLLMNPEIKPVVMKGVDTHPGMLATVYWDPQTRKAYFGNSNLPIPPSGKEYQLWAIIDGKPVDMGLYNGDQKKALIPMKEAAAGNIQAFAITLEKEGGSQTPTMEQMYVMGHLQG